MPSATRTYAPLLLSLLLAPALRAAAPVTLGVQARLETTAGAPVTDPTTVTLRLFDLLSGGTPLHTEVENTVPDADGVFATVLGDGASLPTTSFDGPLFLEVQIDGEAPMDPRLPLASTAYAIRATLAEGLAPEGDLALGGFRATGLGEPSAADDAATKGYADDLAQAADVDISANASDIATLTVAVQANAATAAQNSSDVTTLSAGVMATAATAAQNAADITTTSAALGVTQGDVAGLTADVGSLSALQTTTQASLVDAINELEARAFGRVVLVPASGTDTENGDALKAAMDALSGTGSLNQVTLQLEAGTYDLGAASSFIVKTYVHIRGAGRDATVITAPVGGTSIQSTVNMPFAGSSLTALTVRAAGGGDDSGVGIYSTGAVRLHDIRVEVEGGTSSFYGIRHNSSATALELTDSVIVATGSGQGRGLNSISAIGGNIVRDCRFEVESTGSAATGFTLDGNDNVVEVPDLFHGVQVRAVSHTSNVFGAILRDLTDVEVRALTVSGTTTGSGFVNGIQLESPGRHSGLQIEVASGSGNASAAKAQTSTGIVLQDAVLRSTAGGNSYGLEVASPAEIHVLGSILAGDTDGVHVASGGTAFVSHSQVTNGTGGAGTIACYASHDEALTNSGGTLTSCP